MQVGALSEADFEGDSSSGEATKLGGKSAWRRLGRHSRKIGTVPEREQTNPPG